jgi:hypothetical protein
MRRRTFLLGLAAGGLVLGYRAWADSYDRAAVRQVQGEGPLRSSLPGAHEDHGAPRSQGYPGRAGVQEHPACRGLPHRALNRVLKSRTKSKHAGDSSGRAERLGTNNGGKSFSTHDAAGDAEHADDAGREDDPSREDDPDHAEDVDDAGPVLLEVLHPRRSLHPARPAYQEYRLWLLERPPEHRRVEPHV